MYLISHFYNEEFLLPHWINHHKNIFDEAILIDYHSTDNSVKIIEQLAPKNWKVIKSKNKEFIPKDIDDEVMEIEKSLEKGKYKIVLNTTEFLFGNLKSFLKPSPRNYQITVLPVVENLKQDKPYNCLIPLTRQRYYGLINYPDWRKHRFLHNHEHGNYVVGRHETNYYETLIVHPKDLCILWYNCLNIKEMYVRKIEIQKRTKRFRPEEPITSITEFFNLIKKCQDDLIDLREYMYI